MRKLPLASLSEIRDNTERIIELLERPSAPRPEEASPSVTTTGTT
jgi:hypothetical protein